MAFKIKGPVHEVFAEEQLTATFKKRAFIVEYAENPKYPEYIKIEAINDRCSLLDELTPGDMVEVDFNIKGRPWTNAAGVKTYFNQYVLWRLMSISQPYAPYKADEGGGSIIIDRGVPAGDDDLPF